LQTTPKTVSFTKKVTNSCDYCWSESYKQTARAAQVQSRFRRALRYPQCSWPCARGHQGQINYCLKDNEEMLKPPFTQLN